MISCLGNSSDLRNIGEKNLPFQYFNDQYENTCPERNGGLNRCNKNNRQNDFKNNFKSDQDIIPKTLQQEEKKFKLFFLHNDEVKPILSANIKSGIYKKISPRNKMPDNFNNKKNVFISRTEKCGKILKVSEFENFYQDKNFNDSENCLSKILQSPEIEIKPNEKFIETVGMLPESPIYGPRDRLNHFAYEVLKLPNDADIEFNKEKNQLIYKNRETKKKIVYRIIRPDDLNIHQSVKTIYSDDKCNKKNSDTIVMNQKFASRGRRKKALRKRSLTNDDLIKNPKIEVNITSQTRYGRLSKPPEYIHKFFQIHENDLKDSEPIFQSTNDYDYKYSKIINENDIFRSELPKTKRERNIPADFQCNICNKIYLGKKMMQHLQQHPDHCTNSNLENYLKATSIFEFLVNKIQSNSNTEEEKIGIFLQEITDFVNQLQSRSSRLIHNDSDMHFVNSQVSRVLGVREGHFGIDINAINELSNDETNLNAPILIHPPPPPRLDYNLSMSLDDTRLNLSENMLTSDYSLLRTVDDLVKERIKNFTTDDDIIETNRTDSTIHYDHASDNAVEAVTMKETRPPPILGLSLDLFEFNSN